MKNLFQRFQPVQNMNHGPGFLGEIGLSQLTSIDQRDFSFQDLLANTKMADEFFGDAILSLEQTSFVIFPSFSQQQSFTKRLEANFWPSSMLDSIRAEILSLEANLQKDDILRREFLLQSFSSPFFTWKRWINFHLFCKPMQYLLAYLKKISTSNMSYTSITIFSTITIALLWYGWLWWRTILCLPIAYVLDSFIIISSCCRNREQLIANGVSFLDKFAEMHPSWQEKFRTQWIYETLVHCLQQINEHPPPSSSLAEKLYIVLEKRTESQEFLSSDPVTVTTIIRSLWTLHKERSNPPSNSNNSLIDVSMRSFNPRYEVDKPSKDSHEGHKTVDPLQSVDAAATINKSGNNNILQNHKTELHKRMVLKVYLKSKLFGVDEETGGKYSIRKISSKSDSKVSSVHSVGERHGAVFSESNGITTNRPEVEEVTNDDDDDRYFEFREISAIVRAENNHIPGQQSIQQEKDVEATAYTTEFRLPPEEWTTSIKKIAISGKLQRSVLDRNNTLSTSALSGETNGNNVSCYNIEEVVNDKITHSPNPAPKQLQKVYIHNDQE